MNKAVVFSWLQAAISCIIDYSQDCRIFAALSDDKPFNAIGQGYPLFHPAGKQRSGPRGRPRERYRRHRRHAGIVGADLPHGRRPRAERRRVGRHMPAARSTATAARNPHTLGAVGRETGGKVPPPAANGLKTRSAVLRRGAPHVAAQRARAEPRLPYPGAPGMRRHRHLPLRPIGQGRPHPA